MAYRKNYRKNYRRRRYRRRKPADNFPVMGSGPSVLSWAARNAGKALGIATKVAGMVNAELKYFDEGLGSTATTTTWNVYNLTDMGQGVDEENRIGRSIKLKSVYMLLNLASATAATQSLRVRCVFFIDRWQNGTQAAGTDVYETNSVDALRLISSQQSRFKILQSRTYVLNTASGGPSVRQAKFYMPMNHHVHYVSTGGGTASAGAGSVYFMIISDSTINNAATYSYNSRIRFYDN